MITTDGMENASCECDASNESGGTLKIMSGWKPVVHHRRIRQKHVFIVLLPYILFELVHLCNVTALLRCPKKTLIIFC